MKRLKREYLKYGLSLLLVVSIGIKFPEMFSFNNNNLGKFPTYVHVINNTNSICSVYSIGGKGSKKQEMGQVKAHDGDAFPLADDVKEYHWRIADSAGKILKEVTVSRVQVQKEKKYHHRFHGGTDDYDVVVSSTR